MGEIFILSALLLMQLQSTWSDPWICYPISSCVLRNITWTDDTSVSRDGIENISFNFVTVTHSSPDFFAKLLGKAKSFTFYRSAASHIYVLANLLDLTICEPVTSVEIIIEPNVSYQLKSIHLVKLDKLPSHIIRLHSLENFFCRNTPVIELDLQLFADMKNLTSIQLWDASTIHIVVPELLQLKSLRKLGIMRNQLSSLNVTSRNFPSLEALNLENNKFTTIPKQIATFKRLTDLEMGYNEIKFIDMDIFANMENLINLLLINNHITSIVGELQLPRLSELRLDSNNLTELDVSRWSLPALTYINLSQNRLKSVRGFVKCFDRAKIIHLFSGVWDCNWLKEIGRSIRGLVVTQNLLGTCNAFRKGMAEQSILVVHVNETHQVHTLVSEGDTTTNGTLKRMRVQLFS